MILIVGVLILISIIVGCLPTSETAGISALSTSYSTTPGPTETASRAPAAAAELPTPTPGDSQVGQPTAPSSPAALFCREKTGSILRDEIPSVYLKEPLEFRVYLPPCFPESKERSYPLLILLHGSIFSDDQWDRLGVDETADRLITAGTIPPLIIVMPCRNHRRFSYLLAGAASVPSRLQNTITGIAPHAMTSNFHRARR
jgi:hypothetical protein